MTFEQLPAYFLPLFAAIFAVNASYIGSLFLLQRRLVGTPHVFNIFGGSMADTIKGLGFVFSGKHADLQDPGVSRLVWLVRVLFTVGLVGTLSFFALVFGLAQGAA